jgi:hypothetical protein
MTRYSAPNEFRTGSDRTARYVLASRAALLWERVWPGLWPASGILGLFVAAALFDLFAPLPWVLHALILSGVITAAGLALYFGLREVCIPRWADGARRLERTSGLSHRPISEGNDAMALGRGDALAEQLWELHLRQLLAGIKNLKLAWPAPGLAKRDPRALRFVVLALIVVGSAVAGRDTLSRLWAGFYDTGAASRATIDAWIDPPPYTGMPPVYLGGGMSIAVPEGSILNLRVHGAGHTPGLIGADSGGFAGGNGEYSANLRITADGRIRVRSGGRAIGDWTITAIPDKPPTVAFAAPPGKTERQVLSLAYKASDDYGVAKMHALITPHGRKGKAIVLDLPLATTTDKTVSGTSYNDLTAHPYAGLQVDIVLQAVDGAGHVASTKPATFKLPARIFTDPLARALIEQRQNLSTATSLEDRKRVVRVLDALMIAPEIFYASQQKVYMGLRAARFALAHAERASDVEHVQDLLWQIAIAIERGGLLNAAEELRRIQSQLAQALAQGAPQEVINELLNRYNDAMQRYMRALAENPGAMESGPPPPGAKTMSQQDLNTLLDTIRKLSESGSREDAAKLLALMQQLLENLRLAPNGGSGNGMGGGPQSPQDKATSDALKSLNDLMGKQRELLDRTFKGRQGDRGVDPKKLQGDQNDLQKKLGDIMKNLGGQKPGDIDRALRSMGQSQQELGNNDLEGSSIDQKNALDALRGAAADLSSKLMKDAQKEQNGTGRAEDPLGRAGTGNALGGMKVPDAKTLQRARDILLELRRRAGERGRPQEELDYIDRLLKEF